MDKIKDYIFINNYLNNEQCQKLIELFKNKVWTPHEWYNNKLDKLKNKNTDCMVSESDSNIDELLIPIMRKSIEDYEKKIIQNFISKMTKPRLNKYEVNQNMKTHVDHIHSIFDGKDKGVPILSIVGLINDDFEGGEFYINNEEVKFNKGDIMIFPSNFMYSHGVKPITKGKRYSYVSWGF